MTNRTPPAADRDRPLRVLVVTTVHTPLDARIHHRQIRALRAAGGQVTHAAPWTATSTSLREAAPGVVPVDLPRAVGRRRLAALRAARSTIRHLGPRHDLILLHDPELALAVAGRLRRLPPVVLDVHEDLGASLRDRAWIPGALRVVAGRLARGLEGRAERTLAGLLLAEDSYRARFRRDHAVVSNLPWLPTDPPPAGTHHRVVYLGRLSTGRGARELIALGRILATEPGAPSLELVGPADDEVRADLRRAHDDGVLTWHGFVENDEALELVAGSVAGLAPLHDLPNYRGSMPTKVVEYLAQGVPAIVTPLPEAAALVRAADAGTIVDFGDVSALAAAVRHLGARADVRTAMGERGRRYVAAHRSWDAEAGAFVAILHRLADRPLPSPGMAGPAGSDGGSDGVLGRLGGGSAALDPAVDPDHRDGRPDTPSVPTRHLRDRTVAVDVRR